MTHSCKNCGKRPIFVEKYELCKSCYQSWYRSEASHRPDCINKSIGCPNKQTRKSGYCGACHVNPKRFELPENLAAKGRRYKRGPKNNLGSYVNERGYRMIRTSKGWMLEHRAVMELVLGRELESDEQVHHIDGNKLNNEPSNLELWSKAQPTGQRVADLLAFARRIIERYG